MREVHRKLLQCQESDRAGAFIDIQFALPELWRSGICRHHHKKAFPCEIEQMSNCIESPFTGPIQLKKGKKKSYKLGIYSWDLNWMAWITFLLLQNCAVGGSVNDTNSLLTCKFPPTLCQGEKPSLPMLWCYAFWQTKTGGKTEMYFTPTLPTKFSLREWNQIMY